jgi:hypothetical protein
VIVGDDYPSLPSAPVAGGGPGTYALPLNVPLTNPPTAVSVMMNFKMQSFTGAYTIGSLNGRIFRLGAPVAGAPGIFNLDPQFGMQPIPSGWSFSPDVMPNPFTSPSLNSSAKVYLIGAGRTDPTATGTNAYTGPAQDIGAYVSYFQVQ